jgi:hypothetical protein
VSGPGHVYIKCTAPKVFELIWNNKILAWEISAIIPGLKVNNEPVRGIVFFDKLEAGILLAQDQISFGDWTGKLVLPYCDDELFPATAISEAFKEKFFLKS